MNRGDCLFTNFSNLTAFNLFASLYISLSLAFLHYSCSTPFTCYGQFVISVRFDEVLVYLRSVSSASLKVVSSRSRRSLSLRKNFTWPHRCCGSGCDRGLGCRERDNGVRRQNVPADSQPRHTRGAAYSTAYSKNFVSS